MIGIGWATLYSTIIEKYEQTTNHDKFTQQQGCNSNVIVNKQSNKKNTVS